MDWDWLHLAPEVNVEFLPQEDEPDLFELVYVVRYAISMIPPFLNYQSTFSRRRVPRTPPRSRIAN
jgi:hypothetical protein